MPVMDEFREEREAMKHGTPREKLSYFWYYYKWHVIGGAIAIAIIGSLVHTVVTQKDAALYVATLNCTSPGGTDEYVSAVADYAGIDLDEYSVTFETYLYYTKDSMDDSTYTTVEKLALYATAGDLDALMAGGDAMEQYANSGELADLRELLTEEQLAVCEPYFYYVDRAVVEARQEASQNLDDTAVIEIPDPHHPEEMEDPVPVAIYIDESSSFPTDILYFSTDDAEAGIAIGVYQNAPHSENTLKFLEYLIEGLPT